MSNIKDFPELTNPSDADWILIQENNTIPAYKKTQLINIRGGGGANNSNNWQYRDGSVNFSISQGNYLVNTPQDVTIDLNSVSDGIEIKLLRTTADNSLFLSGIDKIKGVDVSPNSTIKVVFNEAPVSLIYINHNYGWLFIPSSSILVTNSLNLPSNGLMQVFNTASIQASNGSKTVALIDEVSGNDATQSNSNNQAIYTENIFAQNTIPGLLFSGNQEYITDLSYLANQKYTIAIVDARTSANQSYIFGNNSLGSNAALHVGYRSNSEFTLAQYDNDLNANIDSYSGILTPNLWIVSNNSRGKEIYQNGVLIASNSDTIDLLEATNGRIGSALGDFYQGYLGLIAVYIGDKTATEITDISNAINSTFGIY